MGFASFFSSLCEKYLREFLGALVHFTKVKGAFGAQVQVTVPGCARLCRVHGTGGKRCVSTT